LASIDVTAPAHTARKGKLAPWHAKPQYFFPEGSSVRIGRSATYQNHFGCT